MAEQGKDIIGCAAAAVTAGAAGARTAGIPGAIIGVVAACTNASSCVNLVKAQAADKRVAELEAQVAALQTTVKELQAKLGAVKAEADAGLLYYARDLAKYISIAVKLGACSLSDNRLQWRWDAYGEKEWTTLATIDV